MQSFHLQDTYQFNYIIIAWARHYNFLFANDNSQDCSAVIQTHVIWLKILCSSYHTFWRVPESKFSYPSPPHVQGNHPHLLQLESHRFVSKHWYWNAHWPRSRLGLNLRCTTYWCIGEDDACFHFSSPRWWNASNPKEASLPTPTPQPPPGASKEQEVERGSLGLVGTAQMFPFPV